MQKKKKKIVVYIKNIIINRSVKQNKIEIEICTVPLKHFLSSYNNTIIETNLLRAQHSVYTGYYGKSN